MSVNSEGTTENSTARYGGVTGSWRLLRRAIVANESAPAVPEQLIQPSPKSTAVRWAVKLPAGVTSCDVYVGRWVTYTEREATVDEFIVDEIVELIGSRSFEQTHDGDRVGVYVAAITGVPGDGIEVVYKSVAR